MNKPDASSVNFNNIPDEMKNSRRWVLWKFEKRGEKWTKIPYTPWKKKASSTNPDDWSAFEDALKSYETGAFDGVGFVLGADDKKNWLGVDLDNVIKNSDWVNEELKELAYSTGSYMELSPSKTGVHIIGFGKKVSNRCRKKMGNSELEIYDGGRFFTITGDVLNDGKLREFSKEILEKIDAMLSSKKNITAVDSVIKKSMPSESEIIEMISYSAQGDKFDALFNGDYSSYPSRSEALYALISIVNWWTRDASVTYNIISQSALIEPKKWERLGFNEIEKQLNESDFKDFPPWMEADISNLISTPEAPVKRNDIKKMKFEINTPDNHFIKKYVEHWKNANDAYIDYHYATALALLSAGANRILSVKTKNIGDIRSNIWLMLLGKSSFSRKSTAIKPGLNFAQSSNHLMELPGSFTPESLLEVLSDNEKRYHFKDEAGQILVSLNQKAYMTELRDMLCQLYDGTPFRRVLRSKQGIKTEFCADEPYLTLEWATTPENFINSTSSIDVMSGFLFRFLPVFPQYPKKTMGIELGNVEFNWNEISLRNEYNSLVDFINSFKIIEMVPSAEAMEKYNDWMLKKEKQLENDGFGQEPELALSILARYVPIVLKLAMLLTAGGADFKKSVIVNGERMGKCEIPNWSMNEAIRLMDEYFIPVQFELMLKIKNHNKENIQQKILEALKNEPNNSMSKSQLLRKMRLTKRQLRDHLETLQESGEVAVEEISTGGRPKTIIKLL